MIMQVKKIGAASALLLSVGFSTAVNAAAVSGTAQLFDITQSGTPVLTFSNDQYAQGAQTSLGGDLFHFGSVGQELFLNESANGGANIATARSGLDFGVPTTNAGVSGTAQASAFAQYSFDYTAAGSGQVVLNFDYLYSITILDLLAGETAGISALVDIFEEGNPASEVSSFHFFNNENNNDFSIDTLSLILNVVDGQSGTITFTASSQGFASSVPVPAAVWLFGSALAGFIGLNRRKV